MRHPGAWTTGLPATPTRNGQRFTLGIKRHIAVNIAGSGCDRNQPTRSKPREDRMSGKILIVDDEVHIRMLLEQTLEELEDEYDITVLTAADGQEGMDLIRKEKPDIVFLDIMMPKMNGYEVCRNVMDDPALQAVRIVLLTAKGQEVDRKQGLESGAFKYMTKPFDPDKVVDVAKDMLGLE